MKFEIYHKFYCKLSTDCCFYVCQFVAAQALKTMDNDLLKGLSLKIQWNKSDPAVLEARDANIIIKNLDRSINETVLKKLCSSFGTILSLKVVIILVFDCV